MKQILGALVMILVCGTGMADAGPLHAVGAAITHCPVVRATAKAVTASGRGVSAVVVAVAKAAF